jgi:tetrahydromethanopterin S-methyltransferase subunit G
MKMKEHRAGAPVFVKVDEYKEILDVLDMIKSKIGEIRETLGSINEVRNEEDAEVSMWNSTIDDIEKKINGIDDKMAEL